jgi:hypothetical protein
MIGKTLVDVLYKHIQNQTVDSYYPTNLIAYNMIPLDLPELNLEKNLLGGLKWLGISCFIFIAIAVSLCIGWTVAHMKTSLVVSAAQPFFLITIAIGVLILSASMVPLSLDDGGDIDSLTEEEKVFRCMTIPWLAFTGFSFGTCMRVWLIQILPMIFYSNGVLNLRALYSR